LHTPLSASHIFAFVVILGFLSVRPRRVIFSDVQYLARLPQSRTGKINGLILVPIVMNRMRASFYEKLTARLDPRTVPAELKLLARIPLSTRRFLKRTILRAERGLIRLESEGASSPVDWAARRLARTLFGRLFRRRIGSPDFVVVGGAKPNLEAMAFLEVMGIRCLQGWGMTETTGPLAVCSIGDRYRGAFGTCGNLFPSTRAHIEEDGELIVEGPQVACGYHQPDGTFLPFNGRKRTGDHAQFDSTGRLRVVGKAADRITTENGINYNPIPFEEEIHGMDLRERHLIDDVVVIGDGQPRLGVVFFIKEGASAGGAARDYVEALLRSFNARRPVDEQIACWTLSDTPLREAGFLGPSGKLVRRRIEERYAGIFSPLVEVGN
ncbi:MAG TPA: AMP-binding protein, partial [Planctomycetota bacterium]|nr:AMP-binding protein [Planctomycetota bacterium]